MSQLKSWCPNKTIFISW